MTNPNVYFSLRSESTGVIVQPPLDEVAAGELTEDPIFSATLGCEVIHQVLNGEDGVFSFFRADEETNVGPRSPELSTRVGLAAKYVARVLHNSNSETFLTKDKIDQVAHQLPQESGSGVSNWYHVSPLVGN